MLDYTLWGLLLISLGYAVIHFISSLYTIYRNRKKGRKQAAPTRTKRRVVVELLAYAALIGLSLAVQARLTTGSAAAAVESNQ